MFESYCERLKLIKNPVTKGYRFITKTSSGDVINTDLTLNELSLLNAAISKAIYERINHNI